MLNLILPKTRPSLVGPYIANLPLYFLAGPILGGDDWHQEMTASLLRHLTYRVLPRECIVVNPSRYTPDHPHYQYRMDGPEKFANQTTWERYYLREAALNWPSGCIIFWLACESKTKPRNDGLPYAMDTRGELGEWRAHLMHNPRTRLIVGAEPGFPGLRTIQRNFEDAIGSHFKIYDSMDEVAKRAIDFI